MLSVYERTREIGMLRAIGTSRRQMRRIVRYESVITSVIGGVMGIGVGVVFAYAVTTRYADQGFTFSVPFGQLAALRRGSPWSASRRRCCRRGARRGSTSSRRSTTSDRRPLAPEGPPLRRARPRPHGRVGHGPGRLRSSRPGPFRFAGGGGAPRRIPLRLTP